MTEKIWNVEEWRAQFKRDKDKDEERIYNGMKRLTREVLATALVKHHSMDEALMSVYLTGMYHAMEVANRKAEQ